MAARHARGEAFTLSPAGVVVAPSLIPVKPGEWIKLP
jgi:hypothetical protein